MKKYKLNISIGLVLSVFLIGCSSATINNQDSSIINASSGENFKLIKTIPMGKMPHGLYQAGGFVYNSNIGDGTISVIDTKTDSVVKTIKLDNSGIPGDISSFHDNKNVLVTDTKNGLLLIIDPLQDYKIIQKISLGKSPDKIRVSEDDKKCFVSIVAEDKVVELTFDNNRSKEPLKKEYQIGSMITGEEKRNISLVDGFILVPNISDNDVSLINLNNGVEKRLKDGNNPSAVDIGMIDSKASVAIVGNSSSNTVTLFEINSDNKKTISDVGLTPTEITTVDYLNRAYITMAGSNEVTVIDYNKKNLVGKIPVGSRPVHIYSVMIDEDTLSVKHEGHEHPNPELWVANDSGDSVTIIDSATLEVKGTIKVGKGHHKITFTLDKAYVSNINDNTLSVIQIKR